MCFCMYILYKIDLKKYFFSLPFSLSLNRCDLLDEEANLTLRNLGIVSGDLIFVVVASDHDSGEEHNENDNRIPDDDTAAAAAENMDVAQDRGETLATEMPLGGPAVSHSHNTGVTITPSGNPDELLIHDAEAIHDAMSNHYLNEPMFVRDSTGATVPHTLRAIVESGDIENSHDAICTVLHLLMLEAGFRSSVCLHVYIYNLNVIYVRFISDKVHNVYIKRK